MEYVDFSIISRIAFAAWWRRHGILPAQMLFTLLDVVDRQAFKMGEDNFKPLGKTGDVTKDIAIEEDWNKRAFVFRLNNKDLTVLFADEIAYLLGFYFAPDTKWWPAITIGSYAVTKFMYYGESED